jgi:predicted N-acetyltransferase YhbS
MGNDIGVMDGEQTDAGRFRASYRDDPQLGDRVFELLEIPFPGVSHGRRNGEAFEVPWEACSTPFVAREGDRVVGHVGLLEIPLRVMSRDLLAGGVHGVATHPDHRREGRFRALLEELIAWSAPRHEILVLTTLHPEYFVDFGFRVVPEWVSVATPGAVAPLPARQLDLAAAGDLALIHGLIDRRTPVSDRLGVGSEKGCWGFTEYCSTIRYSPSLDAAVVGEQVGTTLRIYDLVAPSLPSLTEIAGIWGGSVERVLLFFGSDKVAGPWTTMPQDLTGGADSLEPGTANWVMMVRGALAAEGHHIMLPRPARC